MNKITVLAALIGCGLAAQAYSETVLFSDTFTVSANSGDINIDNTLGRQSGGTLGPIAYTQVKPDWYYAQVGNIYCLDQLLLLGSGAISLSYVSLDHDFSENPGTGAVTFIRFSVAPVTNAQDPMDWVGLTLGTSFEKRNTNVNATDGFGIIFRGNGEFGAFDGTAGITAGKYTAAPGGWHAIDVRVAGLVDGNPWDGTHATLITCFADNSATPFFSYMKTGVGYTNNWVTLIGYGGSGGTIHLVDDFQIGHTVMAAAPTNLSLSVDFQHSSTAYPAATQAGFLHMDENYLGSATYLTRVGEVTVTLTGLDPFLGGFYNRGGVVNSETMTFADIYNDCAFKNGTYWASPQTITLTLSGSAILPKERYRLTFYAYDPLEGSTHSLDFAGVNETRGTAGPLIYTSGVYPASNSAYAVTGYFTSDASGTLTVLATDTLTGETGLRLCAFEMVADFLPKGTMVSFF